MIDSALRRLRSLGALPVLAALVLCGCSAFEAQRVVNLDETSAAQRMWRPKNSTTEPLFVDTTGALVAKRQLKTAIFVEPTLESFIRRKLETALGAQLDELEVRAVGYRYAVYFPMTRGDDFVLRVRLRASAAGLDGEFEGRIHGNESLAEVLTLDFGWKELIPDTGLGLNEGETTRSLERRADQQAWIQRGYLLEATNRLVANVLGGA